MATNQNNSRTKDSKYKGKRGTNSKRSNYNSRSKKPNFKDEKSKSEDHLKDAINDIAWYSKNPQLLNDAASVPFSQMLGLDMSFGDYNGESAPGIQRKLPGLVLIPVTPCFGVTGDPSSPGAATRTALNVAAQNVYTFVRHQNSGHSNYDATDLMVYIMAMDQLYSFHAELCRLYGVLKFYSGYNRYLGRYLVEALDYDYDDLIANLAQLRYTINTMAAKMSTFAVPAIFPMFERHKNIYSSIYMDQASVKAQCYAFIPYVRGIYNEPVDASGHKVPYKTGLRVQTIGWGHATLRTLSDIQNDIDTIISPLLYSEDIGIMSGDILKAYGVDKCYTVNSLPEDWIVGPVFVPTVLKQIHNSITVGSPVFEDQDGTAMMVWQNGTSPILHTWNKTYNVTQIFHDTSVAPGSGVKRFAMFKNPHLVDTDIDSPNSEEVMEITRLTSMAHKVTWAHTVDSAPFNSSNVTMEVLKPVTAFEALGADAAVAYLVYDGTTDPNTLHPFWTLLYSHTVVHDGDEGPKFYMYRNALSAISKFNWHPTLYEYGIPNAIDWTSVSGVSNSGVELRITSDLDNCVCINTDVLARLHDVALLSLLDVPTTVVTRGI